MLNTLPQLALSFITAGLAAAGVACASIPIIIHLLTRFRRRPQKWGAMKFLLEAYRRNRTRLQLEQWILLVVRCLVLIVLGLALAGPLLELGGCANDVGADATRRTVYLVIDDSLSNQTFEQSEDGGGDASAGGDGSSTAGKRFEKQRDLALKIIDSLSTSDEVALVRTARPVNEVVIPPTVDRSVARRQLREMRPRAGRCDLSAALKAVQDSVNVENAPADRVYVMLLSDYTGDAVAGDRPIVDELKALAKQVRVVSTRPAAGTTNIQIAKLSPRRHLVITDVQDGAGAVSASALPIDIELRRYEDTQQSRITEIRLTLFVDDPNKPIAVGEKVVHRWQAGETRATIHASMPVADETLDALGVSDQSSRRRAIGSVVLHARIEPDALEADNQRFAVIELRKRLRIGLIDDAAAGGNGGSQSGSKELSPNKYVFNALRTDDSINSGFDLQQIPAIDVDASQLKSLDAAVVLRPDLLSDLAWRGLKDLADRGGVVWIFAPITGGPAQWSEALRARLGVPWELEIDPTKFGAKTIEPTDEDLLVMSSSSPIGLDISRAAPEFHQAHAADWAEMLKPVRVRQRYAISSKTSDDHVWIRTADGEPLLVAQGVGEGHVLLWSTALGQDWTNLHTTPLFVPLLGESLQSAVARSAAARRTAGTVVGDTPVLGKVWDGAAQLKQIGAGDQTLDDVKILLRRTDAGFVPVKPLENPGVYQAAPEARGRMIPVNIEPIAGDTTGMSDEQVADWLSPLGKLTWLNEEDPGATFASFQTRTNIGLILLWVTLALVLLELVLARLFSYAKRDQAVGMGAMLANRFTGMMKRSA